MNSPTAAVAPAGKPSADYDTGQRIVKRERSSRVYCSGGSGGIIPREA
jgi:hypothetical protein